MLAEILPDVDLILVMTVNPGFGGQHFIANTLGKIRRIRQMIDQTKKDIELEVDGGIDAETAPQVVAAGARAGGGIRGFWPCGRRGGGDGPSASGDSLGSVL